MKKLFSLMLLIAAVYAPSRSLAQDASAVDAPPSSSVPAKPANNADSSSQKARQLVDQMIAALGGDAWLNYKNYEQQGRTYSFYHGRPNSAGTLFWRFYEYPDKERRELTKQRDVVYIYNGDKGYEKTYKGVAAEEEKNMQEIIRRRQHSLEVVLREWLKDPQTVLLYEGQSVADQQMVDIVSILNKNNDEVTIGLEIHSHLPINRRFTWRDPDKYKVEDETIYGNYRKVQGITTPFTITTRRDGEINGQNFLTHVEYNIAMEPGLFDAKTTYDPQTYNPRAKKK